MDNYIKMCEQAEVIQKKHKWEDSDKLAYKSHRKKVEGEDLI